MLIPNNQESICSSNWQILIINNSDQVMFRCNDLSKLFDASKIFGMLDSFDDAIAIFDMGGVIFNSRVKDVGKAVLPHKYMGQDANALKNRMRTIRYPPHLLEIVDRVHFSFMLFDMQK